MNFQDLMSKMRELDAPVAESAIEECGEPMGMPGMTPPAAEHTTPPSMSLNLNAQGMDDIAELMKLITKVNPDMEKPAGEMPSLVPPGPSITPSLPPLKMLPDLDAEEPKGHSEPDADNAGGPSDNDADNKVDVVKIGGDEEGEEEDESANPEDGDDDGDIMNHLNKKLKPFDDQQAKDKEQEEASPAGFDQASTSPDPEFKDADFMLNKLAGGLNKPKTMTKHGYQQGDNPMAMEGAELRASIRAELLQRLAEAKSK